MFSELIQLHQNDFEAIAQPWLHIGALGVRLVEDGKTIAATPLNGNFSIAGTVGHSTVPALELHIHGVKQGAWQTVADAMAELLGRVLMAETEMEQLTGTLVETQDRLVALYDLTQSSRRTLDVDALLDLLISESKKLLNAGGAFTAMYVQGQPPRIRQSAIVPLPEAHLNAAATIYRRDTRRHNFKDSMTLPRGLNNIIMTTLPVREDVFACIGVFNKGTEFTSHDIKLLCAIADQSGAQIDNAWLYQEALARTRLETEMDLARQVQLALQPQSLPSVDGLDMYGVSIPALQVGGDFFDIVMRKDRPLVFMVGDVTGKGMSAALLMSMTRMSARSAARNMPFEAPHQIVNRLNMDLLDDYSTVSMFSTAFVGTYDLSTRRLLFSNAGQSPVLYMPMDGEPVILEAQDIPVGVLEGYAYSSQQMDMKPGDVLLVATDGFNESRNDEDEMFGIERMLQALADMRTLDAKGIAEEMLNLVTRFSGSHLQDDDRTIIVLKVE